LPLDLPRAQAERYQACRDDQPHADRSNPNRAEWHIRQQTQSNIKVQQQDEANESKHWGVYAWGLPFGHISRLTVGRSGQFPAMQGIALEPIRRIGPCECHWGPSPGRGRASCTFGCRRFRYRLSPMRQSLNVSWVRHDRRPRIPDDSDRQR